MSEHNRNTSGVAGRARGFSSIRTQYAMATAFFLLVALGIFYVGGRIILVHLVREAEQQVRDVGLDVSRLAYRNADRISSAVAGRVSPFALAVAGGETASSILQRPEAQDISLFVCYSSAGKLVTGAQRQSGRVRTIHPLDLVQYSERISSWARIANQGKKSNTVGIMRVKGISHYVTLVRDSATGNRLVIGAPFDIQTFSRQIGEGRGSYAVRVKGPSAPVAAVIQRPAPPPRDVLGLAPMLSEALNFYSGGFWSVSGEPFEAVFAVRDIAGNSISTIAVSMPQAFAQVTGSALGRFTFFVAAAGILLVIPIFWIQARVLLNPLTRMTEAIRRLGDQHKDMDCPRLEWEGRDEFALLAESVNRMLETISSRTVSLGQLKARQRALIEGVPDALAIFDVRACLVSIPKQFDGSAPLPGFETGETISADVFGDTAAKEFADAVRKVFSDGKVACVRMTDIGSRDPDARRTFEVRLSKMDDHFALAIVRDISREINDFRMRLEKENREHDSSKRESLTLLAAGIAHDVNNVLSVILNTVEASAASSADPKGLDAIRDAVRRGSAMTKELMTFAGEAKIALTRMSPTFVVKDVQMLAEGVIGKNVEISYRLAEDVPDIDADPNQFWKVLFNIVKNAAEAIGSRPGHILISTARCEMTPMLATTFRSERPLQPGLGVVIRITDDGPGVAPAVLPRLFDPYVSSKSLGRGLGLATVRTIVEAHGGGIRVASELEKGTTFHIFLPASSLPAVETPPAAIEEGALPAHVLVVDNDEAILKTCSILMRILKVTPHVARDRRESLAFLRRNGDHVGTILLDANLGGIDTVRLLEAFRIAAPGARVVVSSGSSEEAIREMFATHPFDGFLAKPYTLAELRAALQGKTLSA